MKNVVVCDIDGTIADNTHRLHYWQQVPKDWDNFHLHMDKDTFRSEIWEQVISYDLPVIFLSARKEKSRAVTIEWLHKHLPFHHIEELILRKDNDHRKDYDVKLEIYEEHLKDRYEIAAVFEDRPSVIRMWESLGLNVIDCGDGVEF